VPWLHSTCARCDFCQRGRENLCPEARFTGFHVNGGYAETVVACAAYVVNLPPGYDDTEVAPLLCAGVVGYRALRLSDVQPTQRLGLIGFGASAHVVIQIARHRHCEIFVATRSQAHQQLAKELGAAWVGRAEDLPASTLHAAILFAPAGALVPQALRALRKGGTLALAGIYLSPVPELSYELLYHERTVRSVANATREDARELMKVASEVRIRTEVETFPLEAANEALLALKRSQIRGAAVLKVKREA
jgi:propanol-preferring alcohol dehydrogenase